MELKAVVTFSGALAHYTVTPDKFGIYHARLLVEGVCVAERHCEGMMVLLFQLHYFYTEVHFHSETNELIGSRSFDDTDELQPYLQQIDLGSLLN